MNNKYNKVLIKCIDLIIIVLVVYFLIYELFSIIISLIVIEIRSKMLLNNEFFFFFFFFEEEEEEVTYMVENSKNVEDITNVQIIHSNGNWSSGIRSLFIYGTGALRKI